MKKNFVMNLTFLLTIVVLFSFKSEIFAQQIPENKTKSDFWNKVQFGGGLGLGFGSGYTNFSISPSAIYNINNYFATGVGLQYAYVREKNVYTANLYGGSIIGLFNPLEEIQLSVEVEQLKVNNSFNTDYGKVHDDFWNTALFLGAGYRTSNVTIGAKYNVLYKDNQGVYADALMPFIRIYF